MYCKDTCREEFDNYVDFHRIYNDTYLPDIVLRGRNSRTAFFKPAIDLGGKYTFRLKANDLCDDQQREVSVTITCDDPPTIEAPSDEEDYKLSAAFTFWGAPRIYFFTSLDITRPPQENLKYSWKFVNMTLPQRFESEEDYPLEQRLNDANGNLRYSTTLHPTFTPEYPALYTIQLAVHDGCQITNATVDIEVLCSSCEPAPRINAGENEILWNKPTSSDGSWDSLPVSASQSFDPERIPMSYQWSIVSGPSGFMMEETGVGEYVFYEILSPRELISRETEELTDVVEDPPQVDTNGFPFTQTVAPYNVPELQVVQTTVDTTETDTTVVTSVFLKEDRKDRCEVDLNTVTGVSPTITVSETGDTDLDEDLAQCPGYYQLMLQGSDECFGNHTKSDMIYIHVDCEIPPRAFASCDSKVEYNYVSENFPSVSLDGSGTYDPREGAPTSTNHLVFSWEVTSFPAESTPPSIGSTSDSASFTPNFRGSYQITMTAHNQCSKDMATVNIQAVCPEEAPVTALEDILDQQYDGSSLPSLNLVSDANHTFPGSLTYQWEVTTFPEVPQHLIDLALDNAFELTNEDQPVANLELFLPGSYEVQISVDDGCLDPVVKTDTFTFVCDATSDVVIVGAPGTIQFDYDTNSFPSFDLRANDSTIEGDGYNATISNAAWLQMLTPTNTDLVFLVSDYFHTYTPQDGPGSYTLRFLFTDGCNYPFEDLTFTTICPQNPVAVIDVLPATPSPIRAGDVIELNSDASNPDIDERTWYLIEDPNGPTFVNLGSATNLTYTTTLPGTYTFQLTVGDGCKSANATETFEVLCPIIDYSAAAQGDSTSSYSKGKFSRVEVNGANSDLSGFEALSFEYQWEFTAAPAGSIYEPITSTNVTVMTDYSNSTSETSNTTTLIETTEVITVTKDYTRQAFLKSLNNPEVPFASCFFPDLPGTYTLTLTISNQTLNDPDLLEQCYVRQAPQQVVVTAACNSPPTIVAKDLQVELSGNVQTRVTLDASATSDPNGDPLTFMWQPVENLLNASAPINQLEPLTNPRSPMVSFIVERQGVYPFLLTVSDGCTTVTREVTVTTVCPYVAERAEDEDLQELKEIDMIVAQFDEVSVSHQAFQIKDSILATTCVNEYEWELVGYDAAGSFLHVPFYGLFLALLVALWAHFA